MPAVGKEIERIYTPQEITQPVEQVSYVEKVEKQTETQQYANTQPQPPQPQPQQKPIEVEKILTAKFANESRPNINLPMTEQELSSGLRENVMKGIRWASEWCLMMIKKYPSRVFYMVPETKQ